MTTEAAAVWESLCFLPVKELARCCCTQEAPLLLLLLKNVRKEEVLPRIGATERIRRTGLSVWPFRPEVSKLLI